MQKIAAVAPRESPGFRSTEPLRILEGLGRGKWADTTPHYAAGVLEGPSACTNFFGFTTHLRDWAAPGEAS